MGIFPEYAEGENPLDKSRRHRIRITFDNGETLNTEINGTPDEICDYYIGKWFNFGLEEDEMHLAKKIAFFDGEVFLTHKRQA